MENKKVETMKEAQALVKNFAERNNWPDLPNIDKFDHLHEELLEMSQHLRYKNEAERIEFVKNNQEIFKDGIGDLLFALCRLANQLGVDLEEAFNFSAAQILEKYNPEINSGPKSENNIIHK